MEVSLLLILFKSSRELNTNAPVVFLELSPPNAKVACRWFRQKRDSICISVYRYILRKISTPTTAQYTTDYPCDTIPRLWIKHDAQQPLHQCGYSATRDERLHSRRIFQSMTAEQRCNGKNWRSPNQDLRLRGDASNKMCQLRKDEAFRLFSWPMVIISLQKGMSSSRFRTECHR